MYLVDLLASQKIFLISDYFRSLHKYDKKLDVFLCGSEPKDHNFDLRIQVKRILESRMGCKSFLGEDIKVLKAGVHTDRDLLSIEVKEATESDLIFIFLGSVGTISELTAFALNKDLQKKLVVFNEKKYEKKKSFLNEGPLKMLEKDQIIFYDGSLDKPTQELISSIDKIVSEI
jgi:hypothetical protein